MEDADFGSKAVAQRVQLKHLDALYDLLEAATVLDPFEKISDMFKQPLDEAQVAAVQEAALPGRLNVDEFLPYFKDWIVLNLDSDRPSFKPRDDVKVYFGFHPGTPDSYQDIYEWNDVPYFTDHFPDGIKMSAVISVYQLLENRQQEA